MRAHRPPPWLLGLAALAGMAAVAAERQAITDAPPGAGPDSFLAENRLVMSRMMAGMDGPSSGDADRDFARMMIAHHQGAIEMARLELGHGHNEPLRRIAQGIIVEQQQEIEAMRLSLPQAAPRAAGTICGSPPHRSRASGT